MKASPHVTSVIIGLVLCASQAGSAVGAAASLEPEPAAAATGAAPAPPASANAPVELTDGERILFLGDALMAGEMEAGHVESHLRVRFPGRRILCRNMAWKEDGLLSQTGPGRLESLTAWIASYKPSLTLIAYGMGNSLTNKTDPDALQKEVATLVKAAADNRGEANPRWALIGPVPRETNGLVDTNAAAQNAQLRLYENRLRDLAGKGGIFVPLADKFVQPGLATRGITPLTKDSIHPNLYGYARMAESVEIAFNWKPNTWLMGFTWGGRLREDNWGCKITDFNLSSTQACWTAMCDCTPNTAPMGRLRPMAMLTPPSRIIVPGLLQGDYVLRIDGAPVLTNSNQAWAFGEVLFRGAPFEQAENLRLAIVERNRAWARFALDLKPDSKDAAGAGDECLQALDLKIQDLCVSKPHRLEILPLLITK